MDFSFSEKHEMFRKTVREFAETKIAPWVTEMEETGTVCPAVVKALAEAKMMALTIPEEYGGLGLGYTARMIALEEISRVSVATAMMLQVFALGIEPIVKCGTEEQKRKYLTDLATGKRLAGLAVTEPAGGSDPTDTRTLYRKDGDFYLITGHKCFITNAHISDIVTVLAKDEGNPKSFSTFIIEKGTPGFSATHVVNTVGMRGSNTGELVFENVRVPKEQLLGREGDGMRISMAAVGEVGRGGMVGCALGLHTACLEASVKFANERILYGKPISQLPTIQSKLAEMKVDLEAGRLLAYRATTLQDKGLRATNEFAVAKYFTTEAAQKAAKMAVDIHGGYGCMVEYPVTRYLRDAFVLGPSGGTSDIMKVIIARWVLS